MVIGSLNVSAKLNKTRLPCSNAVKDAKPIEITWGPPN